jgi:hypothetical protein
MMEEEEGGRIQAEIRGVFMEHWDPIGINDQPACWDEYDSYIGGALKLLLENGSDGELAEYLRRIVRERMELSPDERAIGNTINALRKIRLT